LRAAKLSSSLIARILYDDDSATLRVCFRHGAAYLYHDVPPGEFEALKAAASGGRYYNACIKGRYRCSFDPERKRYGPRAA
jgi:DNA-binding NarL/FixJ family response regulator